MLRNVAVERNVEIHAEISEAEADRESGIEMHGSLVFPAFLSTGHTKRKERHSCLIVINVYCFC